MNSVGNSSRAESPSARKPKNSVDLEACSDFDIVDSITQRGLLLEDTARRRGSLDQAVFDSYTKQKTGFSCGVASACMVMQALKGDIHEEMAVLDEAVKNSLVDKDHIKKHGMHLNQIFTLLEHLKADVQKVHAGDISEKVFKRDLERVFNGGEGLAMVVNFDSRLLFPRCKYTGHFSPAAALEEDKVLVMDVGIDFRPYWVPVSALFASMATTDRDAGNTRGYVIASLEGSKTAAL